MRSFTTYFLIMAAGVSFLPFAHAASADSIDVDRVMKVAARKLAAFDASHPDKTRYPSDAKTNTWRTVPPEDWVSGFYPGSLWYIYEYAQRKKWPDTASWRKRAEIWTAGLESQQYNTTHHDLGFVVFNSFGNGYRLTGNQSYKPIINQAAQSLATRFRPEVNMIRSWGDANDMSKVTVIIDNVMNLQLLVWASRHGGATKGGTSEDLYRIATTHADWTIKRFVRPDGSTFHVVELDPATGGVIRKRTQQGKADDSTWSRGQAWAVYGFAYLYEATKDRKYLDTSMKAAEYYLNHLPADMVPPSDFQSDLKGLEFKDSSAAAIVASALFRLGRLVDDPALRSKYDEAAVKTLHSLTTPPYFVEGDNKAALLQYAARNYDADPNSQLTNTSLIFGDYYLLEALLQYDAMTPHSAR